MSPESAVVVSSAVWLGTIPLARSSQRRKGAGQGKHLQLPSRAGPTKLPELCSPEHSIALPDHTRDPRARAIWKKRSTRLPIRDSISDSKPRIHHRPPPATTGTRPDSRGRLLLTENNHVLDCFANLSVAACAGLKLSRVQGLPFVPTRRTRVSRMSETNPVARACCKTP